VPCLVYRGAEPADPSLAGSAVLVVHGGPEGQARQNFNTYVQVLAAAGHTVVVPNVRGSVGYGKRWYSMDDVELRLDSVADLAAIHSHLPALGADPARAALWGGSYGAAWSWPGSRSSRNCGPPEWPSSASRPWSTARRAVSGSGQFRRMLAMRPHG
jgi:hypothetical protein